MTRKHVRSLLDRLHFQVNSTPYGLEVVREAHCATNSAGEWYRTDMPWGTWYTERWRLECGSGIAGKSGVWSFRPVGGTGDTQKILGPFTTQKALEKTLRRWRRWSE